MSETRRGRPRSPETIERDRRILSMLQHEGPMTRNRISDRLGISKSLASIAINRLKDAGSVRRCVGEDGENIWVIATEEPCP